MQEAIIKILHKVKDESNNTVVHKETYDGKCRVDLQFSVREQLGGVENNSETSVLIFTTRDIDVECGDRCILNGRWYKTVKEVRKCLWVVNDSFKHIALVLR